jgi:hypothetical protein
VADAGARLAAKVQGDVTELLAGVAGSEECQRRLSLGRSTQRMERVVPGSWQPMTLGGLRPDGS